MYRNLWRDSRTNSIRKNINVESNDRNEKRIISFSDVVNSFVRCRTRIFSFDLDFEGIGLSKQKCCPVCHRIRVSPLEISTEFVLVFIDWIRLSIDIQSEKMKRKLDFGSALTSVHHNCTKKKNLYILRPWPTWPRLFMQNKFVHQLTFLIPVEQDFQSNRFGFSRSFSVQKPISCLLARTASQKKTPALACRLPVFAKLAEKPLAFAAAPSAGNNLYIRPVRPELPGSVRLGFIPEEWLVRFSFWIRMNSIPLYRSSFQVHILLQNHWRNWAVHIRLHIIHIFGVERNLCHGSWVLFCYFERNPLYLRRQKIGSRLQASIRRWNRPNRSQMESEPQRSNQNAWSGHRSWEGQLLLNDAKKEDVRLQLEAAYRERLALVYEEVKRRLEFQVECQHVERRIKQKHLVNWVHSKVIGSITPEQDKKTFQQCIAHLDSLGSGDNSAWNGCKVCWFFPCPCKIDSLWLRQNQSIKMQNQ